MYNSKKPAHTFTFDVNRKEMCQQPRRSAAATTNSNNTKDSRPDKNIQTAPHTRQINTYKNMKNESNGKITKFRK